VCGRIFADLDDHISSMSFFLATGGIMGTVDAVQGANAAAEASAAAVAQSAFLATIAEKQDLEQPTPTQISVSTDAPKQETPPPSANGDKSVDDLRVEHILANRDHNNVSGLARDLSRENPTVIQGTLTQLSPEIRAQVAEAMIPLQLENAARLHGKTEMQLAAIQTEINELGGCYAKDPGSCRLLNIDHLRVSSGDLGPIRERVAELHQYEDAGLAEKNTNGQWRSTAYARAYENGLIRNQADHERFWEIAKSEGTTTALGWASWRAVELGLNMTPARGSGAATFFVRAPQSTAAALNVLNRAVRQTGIGGTYRNVVENMSARAIQFQQRVSGGIAAGTSFLRNGVKFDAVDTARGVLIDAKGPGMATFVDKSTGRFYNWFEGGQGLVDQAQRQLRAAGGMPVEWVFAEREAMTATRRALEDAGITGITLRHL
jgi:hypothetical protein